MYIRSINIVLGLTLPMLFAVVKADASIYQTNMDPLAVDELGYSDLAIGQLLAQRFLLNSPAIVGRVEFLGAPFPDNSSQLDAFTITFYGDVGGVPDTDSAAVQIIPNRIERTFGGASQVSPIFKYVAEFESVRLDADRLYWITITNDTRSDATSDWVWAGQKGGGDGAIFRDPSLPWQPIPYQYRAIACSASAQEYGAC